MSLAIETIKNLSGYSCAKYSTWFYYRPDHLLFDAGEGISVRLRNMIYGINHIFISHNHGDHIGGIPGFIKSRASSMGDTTKPLSIYYPKGDYYIEKLKQYLDETLSKLPYPLYWVGLEPGETVSLSKNRYIETFASQHIDNVLTLGYKIVEKRKRLKEEFRNLPQKELVTHIKKHGSEEINEFYLKNLLVYTGDTMPINKEIAMDTEVLIHDATFANIEDRQEPTHACISEVMELAKECNAACLALFHFSSRYTTRQIKEKIAECIQKNNITIPVFYMITPSYQIDFKQI